MEVREDDESFKNAVDLLFDALEQKDPDHFALRQYKKYKLAAGETRKKHEDTDEKETKGKGRHKSAVEENESGAGRVPYTEERPAERADPTDL